MGTDFSRKKAQEAQNIFLEQEKTEETEFFYTR
jgi:hypothetical protein